ncbi:hypothetical protein FACS189426_07320 [Bacteroidia bacterium]|nr:hypothetical protein FACS189426_07320 [Bacteroidia bacterium]
MKKHFGILILFSLLVTAASAQKLKGNLDFLKGQERVNVVFDFKGVTIDGDSEESYVKEQMQDEKTPEDADVWKTNWENSARENFQKTYIQYFNDESKNIIIGVSPDAEYTIIVKILDIDPGNFAGPFSNPAKIRSSVNIVKKGEETALASITGNKDYNHFALSPILFDRIAFGFGEAGKMLGKFLNKKIK